MYESMCFFCFFGKRNPKRQKEKGNGGFGEKREMKNQVQERIIFVDIVLRAKTLFFLICKTFLLRKLNNGTWGEKQV